MSVPPEIETRKMRNGPAGTVIDWGRSYDGPDALPDKAKKLVTAQDGSPEATWITCR